jgi:chemotaxis protein CheD
MTENIEKKFIHVGQLHIAKEPTQIVTVLGSCVAVCLYDQKKQYAGMNHYLLPFWSGDGLKSLKYGNVSINKLVEEMQRLGCSKSDLVAKVFGGANMHNAVNEKMMIGKKNAIIAEQILQEHNIPIVAYDLGGNRGRRIAMNSIKGSISLKYVKSEIED